jgi:hypothetical protein
VFFCGSLAEQVARAEVDIKIIYGNDKRPIGFEVDSWIDGVKQLKQTFNN